MEDCSMMSSTEIGGNGGYASARRSRSSEFGLTPDAIRLRKFTKRMKSSRSFDSINTNLSSEDGGSGYFNLEPGVQVVRTSKKLAQMERLDQLTSHRTIRSLQDKGKLYGREKETAALKAFLEKLVAGKRIPQSNREEAAQVVVGGGQKQMLPPEQAPTQPPGRRGLILLKGYSGSGKTALASTLKDPVKEHEGLYVSGKFDLYLRDAHPYYGIAAACGEICRQISNLGGNAHDELQEKLTEKLGPDVRLLMNVAPEMAKFVDIDMDSSINNGNGYLDNSVSSSPTRYGGMKDYSEAGSHIGRLSSNAHGTGTGNESSKRAKAKLHYVFRVFMRLITSYYAPLCIVLDDLQWADPASLDLVQALLTDRDNPYFMVVGLYRSNEAAEISESHILHRWISHMNKADDNNLDIAEMEVGNLGVDAVKSISMDLLSLDDDSSTQELAELCHKRTQGNIFFLIAFMAMLEEEGFLNYDLHVGRYTWDIESIKAETGAASNMVDLMNDKMAKLPRDYGLLLSLAACLGSTFELTKLTVAWKHFAKERLGLDEEDTTTNSLEHRLSRAVQEGFLESLDEPATKYRWIHDKVQEAAFTLIPEAEWSSFKFHLGDILCAHLSDEALDSSIFLVVNLLNEAPSHSLQPTQRLHVADLNLQATEKAVSFSAFYSAAKYAGRGIELLPVDSWTNSYWLTLELYSFAAEAEDFVGNNEKMKFYCDEILNQEVCPLIDKLRVYNVLVSSMANLGNHVDAVALNLKVLEQLKVKFPKSGPGRLVATVAGLMKAKARVRSRTPVEIAKLPLMEDMLQIEIMKLLDKLTTSTYFSGSDLCPLSVMKCTKLTLQNGLCEFSPPAFAAITFLFTGILSDPVAGAKMGEYALLLLEKLQSRNPLARTKYIVHFFGFSWTKPFQNLFAPLLAAYEDGLASGDTESAMWGIFSFLALSFMSGQPLKQLEGDCSNYTKQMNELKRQQAVDFTAMLWQAAHNLMGLTDHTTTIQGDVLADEEDFLALHKDNPPVLAIFRAQQLRLYATFGEFTKGANLFLAHGYDFPSVAPAHPLYMATVFCGGLCSFAIARTTKKSRFKKHAQKARTMIKGWVNQGNPNAKHWLALLDAENAALHKKQKVAEESYQSAIALAARCGFSNDAALANERYGEFMLSDVSDRNGAMYYLQNAIKFYAEWGATRKVEILRELHSDLLQ